MTGFEILICKTCLKPNRVGTRCHECNESLRLSLRSRAERGRGPRGIPILSFGSYEGVWGESIRRLKRAALPHSCAGAFDLFCNVSEHWSKELGESAQSCEALVAVPSNPWRCLGQTDLSRFFALRISQLTKVPVAPELLAYPSTRTIGGGQKLRTAFERRRSMQSSGFQLTHLRPQTWKPRSVMLVDDVSTTGASLESCTRILEATGISVKGWIVLANVELKR